MFHVLIELTVSTKLLNVSNIQKRKHYGKEADDTFYFILKNTSAASNYKKCGCSYTLPEINAKLAVFF